MKIQVWSDYVCPFCYIGKTILEKAIEEVGISNVEIEYKSFELDPNAGLITDMSIDELMSKKYKLPLSIAKKQNESIVRFAKSVGLDFNFVDLKPTNTFDAHRVAFYAKQKGLLSEYTDLVMRSYFTDSLLISDRGKILELSSRLDLNQEDVLTILESSKYANDVRQDEKEAYELGVNGVPYFKFENGQTLYGAHSMEEFIEILKDNRGEQNE